MIKAQFNYVAFLSQCKLAQTICSFALNSTRQTGPQSPSTHFRSLARTHARTHADSENVKCVKLPNS